MTHNNRLPFQCKNLVQLAEKIKNPSLNIDSTVHGSFRVIITRCLQSSPHKRIKLESILKHVEIKKHLKGTKHSVSKNLEQIDNKSLPTCAIEWSKVIDKVPNNMPSPLEKKEKNMKKTANEFMASYSKDNLIQLNGRLIDIILEKSSAIKLLEDEIMHLKQLKIDL